MSPDGQPARPVPWASSVEDLAAQVRPGERISVGGVHFMRAPVALLRALTRAGHAGDLTYVAWGGGVPLEILLSAGLVSRAEMCFSGMDVFGLARRFRKAAGEGTLEVTDYTALSLINGLRARGENLAFEVLQEPAGSDVTARTAPVTEAAPASPAGGDTAPMVKVGPVDVDVMLLHAQRADNAGNVEIAGARATDLATIFAARRVLVTVEERVRTGLLGAPRSFILPRSHVSGIALAPFGAFPTSCLPYYTAHYPTLGKLADPAGASAVGLDRLLGPPEPAVRAEITGFARWQPPNPALLLRAQVPTGDPDASPGIDEIMTILIANTVRDDSLCSFGSASLLPAAAYLLAKASHAPRALLMSGNGGYVDIAARPLSLSFGESIDFRTAAVHAGGDETYHWYYQPGRITHEVVGAAQVDARGSTNNLWIARASGGRIRLPGQGGMADVANLHRDFVIYIPRQNPRNTVACVDTVSARREWSDPHLRRRYGLAPGAVRFVTDYGVMEPSLRTGLLEITALHPGVTVDQFRAAAGFPVEASDQVTITPEPGAEQLRLLREEIDPLAIRKLEFTASADRLQLIETVLNAERAAWVAAAEPEGEQR